MPKTRIDLVGHRFGKLLVISHAGVRGRESHFHCACDCGGSTVARASRLKNGKKQSCGCMQYTNRICVGGYPRWYHIYLGMVARCTNTKDPGYGRYGAAGISVCQRWLESPHAFLDDMGEPPAGMSIDRIDNNGDYEPGNCRWATPLMQMNNRSCNRRITHNGVTQTLSEWARQIGLSHGALRKRLASGWPLDRALSRPVTAAKSHPWSDSRRSNRARIL